MLGIKSSAQPPEQDQDPEEQSNRKQNLPNAAEVKILKTLVTEPHIVNESLNAREFSKQTPDHDDHKCA